MTDDEIVAAIAAAVHRPYRVVWREQDDRAWQPVRRVLGHAVAAHAKARDDLAADGARSEYRRRTARDVLKPLRLALRRSELAVQLHDRLDATAEGVRAALNDLPALALAPVAPTALHGRGGLGAGDLIGRFVARALRPIVWRRSQHDVPVSRLARAHLESDVVPGQVRAFRASQRARAAWLGQLERAWSAWMGEAGADQVEDAAAQLHSELQALVDGISAASGRAAGEDFGRLAERLEGTVAVAGTFVASDRTVAASTWEGTELARRWDDRAERTGTRLELYQCLLGATGGARAISQRMIEAWTQTAREIDTVVQAVQRELEAGLERVPGLAGPAEGMEGSADGLAGKADGLAAALRAEQTRTVDRLKRSAMALDDPSSHSRDLAAGADEAVADIEALCLQLPETLAVHDIPDPGESIRRPGRDVRAVEVREAAVQAFDTLKMERIRTAPQAVVRALEEVGTQVAELREVASYAYEAAVAELTDAADTESEHTIALVTNGLERAGDKAARARAGLERALAAAIKRARDEVEDGVARLTHRVTADRLTAGYLDARSYVATEVARDWRRWRARLAQSGRRIVDGIRTLGRVLRPLATTLGIRPPPAGTTDLSEHTLASATQFVNTLPVVYRRLFAFEPLTDPTLLAGRDEALADVTAAWERWQHGGAGCQVVVSPPGAGITSFLNVVAGHLRDDAPGAVRKVLRARIRTETALAATLGSWLGLGEADDLDVLAEHVVKAPAGAMPRVVVLEGAEHLHLRVRGGSHLFERFLGFVAETESSVFWIVSLTSSAWQLVRKRAPGYVTDVKHLALSPLLPEQLRDAILSRHLRSGLPLQYAEPTHGRDALRTRARRIQPGEKQQQLIEKHYFERLHRASQGSIRLALFHWLRSADFNALEGSLVVQPLEPLSPLMDMLDLTQSFALKAILDHGSLTVDEYREVARAPAAEAPHTFRSLVDQHVIEMLAEGDGRNDRPPLPDERYRVRPFMTGAVIAHLRSRNILH